MTSGMSAGRPIPAKGPRGTSPKTVTAQTEDAEDEGGERLGAGAYADERHASTASHCRSRDGMPSAAP
jgi:hypothetical protein